MAVALGIVWPCGNLMSFSRKCDYCLYNEAYAHDNRSPWKPHARFENFPNLFHLIGNCLRCREVKSENAVNCFIFFFSLYSRKTTQPVTICFTLVSFQGLVQVCWSAPLKNFFCAWDLNVKWFPSFFMALLGKEI